MPIPGLNTQATLYHIATRDEGGDVATYSNPIRIRIAMMTNKDLMQQTPIRSEASASHGRADEDLGNLTALFPPTCGVIEGDRVDALGDSMEVTSVFPREDLFGRLNHFEVTLRHIANVITTPYNPAGIF